MNAVRAVLRICTIAALLAALSSCPQGGSGQGQGQGGPGGMSGPPPVATILEPVMMIDYAPAIELVGEVRAAQRVTLAAEVGGRVTRIAHRVGEAHGRTSGALIQIDPASYQAALDGARANLAQARERLKALERGPRDQEIAAQRAQVAAAEAQYEDALDNLERQSELYDQHVVPESAVVSAEKRADSLRAALEAQQQVLDQLLEGSRTEDVESARAAVDAAQSGVASAELALRRTSITLPFDSVVSKLLVEEGAFVGPGTPVAEVVSSAPCEAWFNLPETDFNAIQPGAAVNVRFDALPDVVIAGHVISVAPAADDTARQFPVRVSLEDLRPKAGMAAYGRLLTAEPTQVMAVKRDAIVQTNLGDTVYVMQPAAPDAEPFMEGMPPLPTVNPVLITMGGTVGDMVVVEGQLQPGMMVVTRGNEQLYQGANIIPTNLMDQAGGGAGPGAGGPPGGAGQGAAGGPAEGMPEGAPAGAPPGGAAPPEAGAGQSNTGADGEAGQ